MKKSIFLLLIISFLLIFSSCKKNEIDIPAVQPVKADAIMKGKIIKIYDDYALVVNEDEDMKSSDIYTVPINANINIDKEKILPGAIVEIGYDGAIQETYPASFSNVKYIQFIENGENLVEFYEKVFDELYNTDEGLNSNIEILAFDMSKTTNLSNSEKNALIYVLGNKYNLETISGTFDELCQSGYINKEELYFEKGLLVTFEVTKESKNTFMFNAQKWRGGLGAYFFQDCQAKKSQNGWDFKIGSEAIS